MNSLPRNEFKQALMARKTQIGLWCNFATLPTVEVLAHAGFDWLLLDMEHTPNDLQILGTQLLALRGTPTAAVVRVPSADMAFINLLRGEGPNWSPPEEVWPVLNFTRAALESANGE